MNKPSLSGKSVADIGWREGWATKYFSNLGASVVAVDLTSAGIKRHNPKHLREFRRADVMEFLKWAKEPYDLIWCNHLLEHMLGPVKLLNLCFEALKPGALLFVTLPNDGSDFQQTLLAKGVVPRPWWVAPPEHLSYFTLGSLVNLGESCGFELTSSLASFPIDWFLANDESNYVKDPAKGGAAHQARLLLEAEIGARPIQDQVLFYSALGNLGLGRDFTVAFMKPDRRH